jgi:hypothetical protein
MDVATSSHYRIVARAIAEGRVVPFLGAGVNMSDRPPDTPWRRGRYLPSGVELAAYLANTYDFPAGEVIDLLRVSQYISIMTGSGPLYEELHRLLDMDYRPTGVRTLLAKIPALLRQQGPVRYQLIATTNHDDLLERAFIDAGEDFDLVCYVAEGEPRGKFIHTPPGGQPVLIERPNEYGGAVVAGADRHSEDPRSAGRPEDLHAFGQADRWDHQPCGSITRAQFQPKPDPKLISILPCLARPLSRGWLRLASADPFEAPLVNPNYLKERADFDRMVRAFEIGREISRSRAFVDEWGVTEMTPGPEVNTPESVREFVRHNVGSYWHYTGACKMGTDDQAVVDPRLRVDGIEGLRIAEASVIPTVPSGNCQTAVLMIAERVAEFIKQETLGRL